ncbi:DUF4160 domain-containing protein [Brevundimonas sp.]|jgi:hypothetical protein|uniref:DUF4160 domain-containing protein n=1 Tax=Brevundimonas sp. TaxID=1871086 RepID=UPI0022C0DDA2|nr:DUF4160 domain-containing protein [Brevundimonas sp.]MCZ8086960.1 DUF4160 domain-containing protein [Brevundimonas sp.]MCZ8193643.1 DUF4160 domain-containing protein [Brevundimonas sp.]
MPTISWFYGIAIRMYFDDHPPAHFHALHSRDVALIEIDTGEIIRGRLRPTEARRVKRWTLLHRDALMENWKLAQQGGNVELKRIAGLDEDDV